MTLLSLVTPATSYPVTREEVKAQLRIYHSDDDALIDGYIAAACEYVEQASGHAVVAQSWKVSVDAAPASRLCLPKYPVTAVTALEYYDADNAAQTLTLSDFALYDSGMDAWIEPKKNVSWPSVYPRPDALSVTFTTGSALAVKPVLKHAIMMLAADWYESPTATGDEKQEIPFGVTHLINLHRRAWIAA